MQKLQTAGLYFKVLFTGGKLGFIYILSTIYRWKTNFYKTEQKSHILIIGFNKKIIQTM